MRLIDADALLTRVRQIDFLKVPNSTKISACEIMAIINKQPTAFDTEKVVEQVEEMKNNKDCQVYCYEFYKKKCMIHEKAIDIVKKGGVE